MIEESRQSGRSVRLWISRTALVMSSASSASGAPMLTSSIIAPPAICCATSVSILDRSPRRSCSEKILRPVGLIRSPITQNGLSPPIRSSLVTEERTVSIVLPSVLGVRHGAAAPQQFLGLDHGRRGVGGIAIRADDVGVL